ncbi:threonine/serine exporter family protein [Gorillibacterium sp. CAU 1737]|uniref:threonine/serine exporter family protein n=1 Tax=Gorillibacterium sp. CAU 1737 TaxID=3140362 RepID=UPI0032617730
MLVQLVTSFVASAAFSILFNVPRKVLLQCGFVGMLGWALYVSLSAEGFDLVISTVAAAFFVTLISQILARMFKTPIIVFSVSGIIPLVPGGLAYDAMRLFVEGDYSLATQSAARAFLISGAIAIGLIFSEVTNVIFKRPSLRKERARRAS